VVAQLQYISPKAHEALVKYAKEGGIVLMDKTLPFDIPGATRLPVDVGNPGNSDLDMHQSGHRNGYGNPERIARLHEVMSEYVKPRFDSKDDRVIATRFEAEGVPYTWFVNAMDGKEYAFCLENMGAGVPGSKTPEKVKLAQDWEDAEMAKGPFTVDVEFEPQPGIPYDLMRSVRLETRPAADGKQTMTLSMDRFGGTLVAWLPAEIKELRLEADPAAQAGQLWKATADVGVKGPITVEFTLTDPKGNKSVVSGVRATTDGKATFEWTPAINDLPGDWKFQARETASGKTQEITLKL